MFAYVKGKLIQSLPSSTIIETGGIGYLIHIPANVFGKLPQINNDVMLHTSYIVRELSHTLYGFLSIQERDVFEILMNVSGIGPKLALSIIGHLEIPHLQKSIAAADIPTLCRVPGIGKKTAERMVIELRDKLPEPYEHELHSLSVKIEDSTAQKIRDAMNALINLGYNQMTAQKAIKKTIHDLSEEVDLPTLITTSLQNVK